MLEGYIALFALLVMAIGSVVAWIGGRRSAMTDLPPAVALFSGLGGGAAAALAGVALCQAAASAAAATSLADMSHAAAAFGSGKALLAVVGAVLGSAILTGSLLAFAKRHAWMGEVGPFRGQRAVNRVLLLAAVVLGLMIIYQLDSRLMVALFATGLMLGLSITWPLQRADMPVVYSLYQTVVGLAVAFQGYVLERPVLLIAAVLSGAAVALLTRRISRTLNRPIGVVLGRR